jgi:hypothetical protein
LAVIGERYHASFLQTIPLFRYQPCVVILNKTEKGTQTPDFIGCLSCFQLDPFVVVGMKCSSIILQASSKLGTGEALLLPNIK